jgi:hypothetical protein
VEGENNKNFVVWGEAGGVWKCYKSPLLPQSYSFTSSFRPHHFFFPSALPWDPLWHELWMTTLDDDIKGKSSFQHSAHLSLTMLTLTYSIITLLFLERSNGMATDICSLAAGLGWHVLRLGNPRNFVLGALRCRFRSHCTSKKHYLYSLLLDTNTDIIIAAGKLSPPLFPAALH